MLYPGNLKKEFNKNINYANRGMNLEALVNEANKYYEINEIAIIYKKPTPVTITKVTYEKNKVLTKGQLQSKSSLDYVGVYKGKYLDFDAKSTRSKTAFPLSNISNHQIRHIKNILKHNGLTFLIIEINNEIYLFKGESLMEFIEANERKSIPYEYLKNKGEKIDLKYNPTLDYLKIVNKLYFKGERYEK
ncbi:MAG: Holliday junction resolvase RecU [Bacilli bacterium]|nr:Holliday junction resolvase RecU [Bacilli bacterium]